MGKKKQPGKKTQKQVNDAEILALQSRLVAEAPPPGTVSTKAKTFGELPLSEFTMMGKLRSRDDS